MRMLQSYFSRALGVVMFTGAAMCGGGSALADGVPTTGADERPGWVLSPPEPDYEAELLERARAEQPEGLRAANTAKATDGDAKQQDEDVAGGGDNVQRRIDRILQRLEARIRTPDDNDNDDDNDAAAGAKAQTQAAGPTRIVIAPEADAVQEADAATETQDTARSTVQTRKDPTGASRGGSDADDTAATPTVRRTRVTLQTRPITETDTQTRQTSADIAPDAMAAADHDDDDDAAGTKARTDNPFGSPSGRRADDARMRLARRGDDSADDDRPHTGPKRSPEQVTVLLVMKPGNRGIRRYKKTADPILCVNHHRCYISRGPSRDATVLSRGRAFGTVNTLGRRAGACGNSLSCVFRNVHLPKGRATIQPIDLRLMRHDRRERRTVTAARGCKLGRRSIDCGRAIRSETYSLIVIPETLAGEAGPVALDRAMRSELRRFAVRR